MYDPSGNYPKEKVYEAGEPCTGCGKNQKCEPKGDGLCTEEGDEVTKKPIGEGVSQTVTCKDKEVVKVMSQLVLC